MDNRTANAALGHKITRYAPYKSLLRAYSLAILSVTSPRIVSALYKIYRKRSLPKAWTAKHILDFLLSTNQFPAFCAILIGTFSFSQRPIHHALDLLRFPTGRSLSETSLYRRYSALLIAGCLSSWASLSFMLQTEVKKRKDSIGAKRRPSGAPSPLQYGDASSSGVESSPALPKPALAGQTIDMTLFAASRGLDIIVGEIWSRRKARRRAKGKWTWLEAAIGRYTDAGIFALSTGIIMWAWFYEPFRLPKSYNRWIQQAAQVDERLIEALRRARRGTFVYGRDTGQSSLLQGMCKDYEWPLKWGDPSVTVPIPCEMVHMGSGPSCEKHALDRFLKAFKFAMATYVPLNLLVRARSPSANSLRRALFDAARSSAFLSSFITLFYYTVCLTRSRLGPKVFGPKTISPMQWDAGLDVGAACSTCGWSILLEAEKRRPELALFVAPRAAATFFPRRYDPKHQWREKLAFTLSMAIVLACAQEKPSRVRGVFGRLLNQVIHQA